MTFAIVPTAALLFFSQFRATDDWREAMSGAVAGTVAMIPEGLVLLTSLAFAVAVVRLAKRQVLVQELPAVEGLARVDVLCIDKTGTLTEGKLAVDRLEPVAVDEARTRGRARRPRGRRPVAQRDDERDRGALPRRRRGWQATDGVPFSSSRKWSAAAFEAHGAWFLGAPDVMLDAVDDAGELRERVRGAVRRGAPRAARRDRARRSPRSDLPPDLEPAAARRARRPAAARRRRRRCATSANRTSR